jgi:hypothetical protein
VEGIAVPHVVLTNTAKYLFTRGYHDAVQDIAGGLLVTGPAEEDRQSPQVWGLIEPYLQGREGVSGERGCGSSTSRRPRGLEHPTKPFTFCGTTSSVRHDRRICGGRGGI